VTNFSIQGYTNLQEVVGEIRQNPGKIVFVAGATDLIIRMRKEGVSGDLMIDLSSIRDLRYIREEGGRIHIGAATPFSEIAESPLIRKKALCLTQAAAQIGSLQIRNRATIGGNIANAAPAGDSLPPLTVLDASVHIIGPRQDRIIPISEINVDPWQSGLLPNELITEVSFLAPSEGSLSGFEKLGHRKEVSVSKLTLAMWAEYDREKGRIARGRVALGAIGKNPILPGGIPTFLEGRKIDEEFAPKLAMHLSTAIDQSIRGRLSRPYKMAAVKGLTYDLVHRLFGLLPEESRKGQRIE
jgi:xanthine dehydrogenase FAD-binding subunit